MTDRVAVITGGTGVLGMVFANTLAEYGARIVLLDVDEQICGQSAANVERSTGRKCMGIKANVSKEDEVNAAVLRAKETFGRIDVLINNAAAQPAGMFAPFEEYSLDVWNQILGVNLSGQFLMAKAVGRVMLEQGAGSIINISSIYGVVGPNQAIYEGSPFNTPAIYSVSKAGVLGLTRYLSTYWGKKGIRANSITPGGVFRNHQEPFLSNYSSRVPMGRMAKQDELRGAIIYLASDASSYVTGHNLIVDGGWTVW